jgi:hypothetical protein
MMIRSMCVCECVCELGFYVGYLGYPSQNMVYPGILILLILSI